MFQIVLLLVSLCAACLGNVAVPPPAQPKVFCGEIPGQIYSCLGMPSMFGSDVSQGCKRSSDQCGKMSCIFRNSGWLSDAGVDRAKVSAHFESFAAEHPAWAKAVAHARAACLAPELPAQGYQLNCPAYDIMMCSLSSFIKNAEPSQWSSLQSCEYPRQYAASCPVCPADCFAPSIPVGSCNACYAQPRSP